MGCHCGSVCCLSCLFCQFNRLYICVNAYVYIYICNYIYAIFVYKYMRVFVCVITCIIHSWVYSGDLRVQRDPTGVIYTWGQHVTQGSLVGNIGATVNMHQNMYIYIIIHMCVYIYICMKVIGHGIWCIGMYWVTTQQVNWREVLPGRFENRAIHGLAMVIATEKLLYLFGITITPIVVAIKTRIH